MPLLWANRTGVTWLTFTCVSTVFAVWVGLFYSLISSLLWISNLKYMPGSHMFWPCCAHWHSHQGSAGPTVPCALRSSQTFAPCPPPPHHGQWGRIPEQGGQATSEPFPSSHLLLWISASTVCWVHTYIVSNLHKTLLGWDHPALICGQKFKDYIISQALSATGFELRSCWPQNTIFPKQASLTFHMEVRARLSESKRIFQIWRKTRKWQDSPSQGQNFTPYFFPFSLWLLCKTNHIGHAHYLSGEVFKKRPRTAEAGLKIWLD